LPFFIFFLKAAGVTPFISENFLTKKLALLKPHVIAVSARLNLYFLAIPCFVLPSGF
jgi:hypothetical protein